MPREAPYATVHLENMAKLSQWGTIVISTHRFYNHPKNIDDMVDFIIARILDQLVRTRHRALLDRRRSLKRPLTADFLNKKPREGRVSPWSLKARPSRSSKTCCANRTSSSGTKAQLVERLQANSATDAVLSIEDEPKEHAGGLTEENLPWWRSTEVLTPQA